MKELTELQKEVLKVAQLSMEDLPKTHLQFCQMIWKAYEAGEKAGQVVPEVKVNFAEIEKELNNYAEEINGKIIDNADACDHLQSKLNYINDNFYLIRK